MLVWPSFVPPPNAKHGRPRCKHLGGKSPTFPGMPTLGDSLPLSHARDSTPQAIPRLAHPPFLNPKAIVAGWASGSAPRHRRRGPHLPAAEDKGARVCVLSVKFSGAAADKDTIGG